MPTTITISTHLFQRYYAWCLFSGETGIAEFCKAFNITDSDIIDGINKTIIGYRGEYIENKETGLHEFKKGEDGVTLDDMAEKYFLNNELENICGQKVTKKLLDGIQQNIEESNDIEKIRVPYFGKPMNQDTYEEFCNKLNCFVSYQGCIEKYRQELKTMDANGAPIQNEIDAAIYIDTSQPLNATFENLVIYQNTNFHFLERYIPRKILLAILKKARKEEASLEWVNDLHSMPNLKVRINMDDYLPLKGTTISRVFPVISIKLSETRSLLLISATAQGVKTFAKVFSDNTEAILKAFNDLVEDGL